MNSALPWRVPGGSGGLPGGGWVAARAVVRELAFGTAFGSSWQVFLPLVRHPVRAGGIRPLSGAVHRRRRSVATGMLPSTQPQAMIKIRFQAVGMNAAQVTVPKEIESPIPFRVDDHLDHLNGGGKPQHLVVVTTRYVVDEHQGGLYQLVGVAANSN
jgi:hypothetical protein